MSLSLASEHLSLIRPPLIGGVGESLYLRGDRGLALSDITRPDEPQEFHTYERPAWFEGVAMGGDLMAVYDSALGQVTVFEAVGKAVI